MRDIEWERFTQAFNGSCSEEWGVAPRLPYIIKYWELVRKEREVTLEGIGQQASTHKGRARWARHRVDLLYFYLRYTCSTRCMHDA
jgi:hypothetical protein